MIIYPRQIVIPFGGGLEHIINMLPGDLSIDSEASYTFEFSNGGGYIYQSTGTRVVQWDYLTGVLLMQPEVVMKSPAPGWMQVKVNGRIDIRLIDYLERNDGGSLLDSMAREIPVLTDYEEVRWEVGSNIPIIVRTKP